MGGVSMKNTWTLHVENFAKIEEAEVHLSPLMCFVGDNNSGKSYLMSLLWGIITLGTELFPKKTSESKSYKACEEWLKSRINQDFEMTDNDIELYLQWFNDLLNINKKKIARKIFNYDIEIGKIEIRNYNYNKKIKMNLSNMTQSENMKTKIKALLENEEINREILFVLNSNLCWTIIMGDFTAPLLKAPIRGKRTGEPVYLPASRTGFMLTYPQLVEKSLQSSFAPILQNDESTLTLPYIDFLQIITKFETKNKLKKHNKWVVDFIETNMTKGNLEVQKETLPRIKYYPADTDKPIPLYVTSSIVSEISPLLLLFKSNIDFKALIIEEPEAHLHPELQQKMARLIINIVNRGIPVWITTHSDTMLQHINNMIKLNNNENHEELMQEYEYTKEDLLKQEDISMYQFIPNEDGRTRLQELECTKHGFIVPTFNDALKNLVAEVYAFQEE